MHHVENYTICLRHLGALNVLKLYPTDLVGSSRGFRGPEGPGFIYCGREFPGPGGLGVPVG